jgi:hypothetical protein
VQDQDATLAITYFQREQVICHVDIVDAAEVGRKIIIIIIICHVDTVGAAEDRRQT